MIGILLGIITIHIMDIVGVTTTYHTIITVIITNHIIPIIEAMCQEIMCIVIILQEEVMLT